MIDPRLAAMAAAAATTFLVLLFLRAAFHKAADFAGFTGFVADYALLPERLVEPVSRLLVAVEALTVASLLLPQTVRLGAGSAIALLVLYAGAIAVNIARGRTRIECGCGGAAQRLSPALLLRNGAMAALALLPLGFGVTPLSFAEALVALAAGLTVFLAAGIVEQTMANGGHIELTR